MSGIVNIWPMIAKTLRVIEAANQNLLNPRRDRKKTKNKNATRIKRKMNTFDVCVVGRSFDSISPFSHLFPRLLYHFFCVSWVFFCVC